MGKPSDQQLSRRDLLRIGLTTTAAGILTTDLELALPAQAQAQDPLPSWNDGAAKKAIFEFVKTTSRARNLYRRSSA